MVNFRQVFTGYIQISRVIHRADGEKKPEGKRPPLTEEQKALRKEMTEKYDKDKDGKLSPEERKAMSAEDKEKMAKAGLGPRRKPDSK